ncbi:MAG: nuclear transport factor 2 family protein [Deltaproteobacteria bacterium]|nr:nuclear transport factor 2 family protein [Deltaproteobacteria bacterium]
MTPSNDLETIVAIIREMAASKSAERSVRHWAEDAVWFDIPPFASKGVKAASAFFQKQFASVVSLNVEILEIIPFVKADMACVVSAQKMTARLKGDSAAKAFVFRQTDCFEKRNGEWKLVHEHLSLPQGGDWDGQFATE